MNTYSIAEIQQLVLNGEKSLKEIVKEYISQIESRNEEINAYTATYFEDALKQAELIEEKMKNGKAGSLAGAVIGIKELICERGKQATAASNMLKNFESTFDATVIEKIKQQDAILIGRLNMDELAMGSTGKSSIYGPAKNPHNTAKVAGGSSGGSAAATAANMATLALGSDTGGSIRQPSSYCGVVGLKPSYGRVSRYGAIAYASSFDCIGPIANSVEDAAKALQVIAGFDERDNTSNVIEVDDYTAVANNPTNKIKIGVSKEFMSDALDPEIDAGIKTVLVKLEANGAEIVPVDLPHLKYSIAAYYALATAEASSNLSRMDGIRYGHRADKGAIIDELKAEEADLNNKLQNADADEASDIEAELNKLDSQLNRLYKKSRGEGFGAEVKRRIILGTYTLSAENYDKMYVKAQKVRRLIQNDFKKAFNEVDVIVCPTAPSTAPGINSTEINNPLQEYLGDLYTVPANLAGICSISVPAGTHSDGMPFGIQFMADAFNESKIINAGRLVELLNNK